MCLCHNTIKICMRNSSFTEEDKLFVIESYDIIWANIDHSRNYCINPKSLCAEILRRSGKTSYDVRMPKNKYKIDQYEKIISIMMDILNNHNKVIII